MSTISKALSSTGNKSDKDINSEFITLVKNKFDKSGGTMSGNIDRN